jgi:hypothetical protein
VSPAVPTPPTITNLPVLATVGGDFIAVVTTNSKGTTSVASLSNGVCSVAPDGRTVTYLSAGTCALRAQVEATADYQSATAANAQSFTVNPLPSPPNIEGGSPDITWTVGNLFSFQFELSGFPSPTVSVTSGALPPGIALSPDGRVSGAPTRAGKYKAFITVSNGNLPDAHGSIKFLIRPTMTISPTNGPPRTALTVQGAGYAQDETVLVTYAGSKSFTICSGRAQRNGSFSCSGKIPSTQKAGSAGEHTVTATGEKSGDTARVPFSLSLGPS